MRSVTRLFSRISLRLMLFNALLVFLPVAGFLLLGTYEQHLEAAQIESMLRQARLIVSMLENGGEPRLNLDTGDTRYRIVDRNGRVTYDSGSPQGPQLEEDDSVNARHNWLY